MKNSVPSRRSAPAPRGLSTEARRWWQRLTSEYDLADDAGQLILGTALEAFDRMRAAQQRIKEDGATFTDRFGQLKSHPLLPVERDARQALLHGLKQLNLDLEPLNPRPGRPGGR